MSMPFPGRGRGHDDMHKRRARQLGFAILLAITVLMHAMPVFAQDRDEATPVRANLVTPTPEVPQAAAPTITPSFTPTSLPAARLQALESAGNVNVRALPDIESDLLGTIAHGIVYPVLRNYYRWYELRFDTSPTGRAWVYGDLVTIEGDSTQIERIDNLDAVQLARGFADSPSNGEREGESPRTIEIATVEAGGARAVEVVDATPLPTFTPPATQPPFVDQLEIAQAEERRWLNLPPLVPIPSLGGIGLLRSVD